MHHPSFLLRAYAGYKMLGKRLLTMTNSSNVMTPLPSLSACFMITSALRRTSSVLEAR